MMRLLRPPHSGIFLRSFRLHSAHYARETIAKICSLWVALATAIISQTGSCVGARSGSAQRFAQRLDIGGRLGNERRARRRIQLQPLQRLGALNLRL
jgi:hypothetical protein